ncbi:MAG: DNA polymerase III subunit gamma/tau [Desulfobacterales bacterium]
MSYLVFARKYRPRSFADVAAQGHVTQTLCNALSSGRLAHAILFAGPRGTGKTTIARILARAVNCENGPAPDPCNRCRSCLDLLAGRGTDVYEIDGASNNNVEQIRELRENLKYLPAHSRYKIYIIDEVHMLSTSAFNALLKTLEEPPAHVLFFFATTEAQKIPATILSRCQRFDLRRIPVAQLVERLAAVCRSEGVEIEPQGLEAIAREADGSLRDALSLLDQVLASGESSLGAGQVLETLGLVDRRRIHELLSACLAGDAARFLAALEDLHERGHDLKKLYAEMLGALRDLWVLRSSPQGSRLVDCPEAERQALAALAAQFPEAALEGALEIFFREEPSVRLAAQPRLAVEMVFFRWLRSRDWLSIDALIQKLERLRASLEGEGKAPGGLPADAPPAGEPPTRQPARPAAPTAAGTEGWPEVARRVAEDLPSLAAALRRARLVTAGPERIEIDPGGNDFLRQSLSREKPLAVLRRVCAEVFGGDPEIRLTAKSPRQGDPARPRRDRRAKARETLNHPLITDAMELFDGRLIDVSVNPEEDA